MNGLDGVFPRITVPFVHGEVLGMRQLLQAVLETGVSVR